MPKPNRDQVKVSHYISREAAASVAALADLTGQSKADIYRAALDAGIMSLCIAVPKGSG